MDEDYDDYDYRAEDYFNKMFDLHVEEFKKDLAFDALKNEPGCHTSARHP